MFQEDLSRILNLSGIKEDAQDDFERRDAIAKLKKLTSGDEYSDANHTYINPKTGAIIYSRDGSPMPAKSFNDPQYDTASVGLELRQLLKKVGLPVTADAKGRAMVDPGAFANLGKDTTPPASQPTTSGSSSGGGGTPPPVSGASSPATTSAVSPQRIGGGSNTVAQGRVDGAGGGGASTGGGTRWQYVTPGSANDPTAGTPPGSGIAQQLDQAQRQAGAGASTGAGSRRVPVGTTDQTMFDRVKYLMNKRR